MSKFIQHLGSNAKRNKLTNWRNHLKNYQCVIQFFCFIPANLVFKYDFQHIETWSSTQKSVNKCKYIYNFKKYRSLYFASWHFVSLRSVVFSGWTPRYEGRKTSASNLLLFQWPSKPTLNAITSYCFAAALDSTTLRKRECKKKNTTTTTTNNNNNNKTEKNTFNKQNNNFARASHIFCTFHGRFARRDYVVETPNFAFWESLDYERPNFFF